MLIPVNNKNISFIQQKISTIRSALLFNAHPNEAFSATSIISALKMDEHGGIWFFLNNDSNLRLGDEAFPARLSFYRKGIPYSLNIYGKATIVKDLHHVSEMSGINLMDCPEIQQKVVLIKVKAHSAEYREWQTERRKVPSRRLMRFFDKLLQPFQHPYEHTTEQYIFN